MTNTDVIKMVKAGLGDALVITSIRQAEKRSFTLTPDGLVDLKTNGVSDSIIAIMLNPNANPEAAPAPTANPVAATAPRPAPVAAPAASPVVAAGDVKVPDGTEVRLRLLDRLTSATAKVNDRVRLEAADSVTVDGKIVIAKGSQAVGTVTEANAKKSFGRSGKLNFTIDAVKAVDGDNFRLRATKENKGNESYGKAGVVTILAGPFGALVRGKDVEIEAGTEYTIYVDGDRTIHLNQANDNGTPSR